MAKINPIRRAEIGREKRARTRAELVAAANSLFARQAVESVTVDDVVKEAGVAKGTFYVHFDGLDGLTAAVAEELVQSFDELLQPGRLSFVEPALRIAFGCRSFIDKALNDPRWASLVARMAAAELEGWRTPPPPTLRRPATVRQGIAEQRGIRRAEPRDHRGDHAPAHARARRAQAVIARS